MEPQTVMLTLLRQDDWGAWSALMEQFRHWRGYPAVLRRLETLRHDALFVSEMHGLGHIERVILHGGLCAMSESLSDADTALLLDVCAYHDVGRQNDGPDPEHGARSALRLAELTGRSGRDLLMLQAAADAHSRPERKMAESLAKYGLDGDARARNLAQLLKDADGLDRVRIGDLEPAMLRRESSRTRVPFAEALFRRYQQHLGLRPEPYFTPDQLAAFRAQAARQVPDSED